MNSKDKNFLEKFRAKASTNLIDPENLGPQGFPLWVGWGCYPAISQKITKYSPIRVLLTPNFYILPIKVLLPLLLLVMGH